MLPVNLSDLTPEHIQGLIDSEVAEGLTLEYKQQLPTNQSEEKKEFLFDIAAMANAAGGDLVYGIAERRTEDNKPTGIPEQLFGIPHSNVQEEIIRLSSYIRDGISPTLTGVVLQSVECKGGVALVIRVPSSWNKPHMVTMGGVDRFYKRTGATKNPMSVEEIRRAFSQQGELRETITQWREHRTKLTDQGLGPVTLSSEVAMLLHAIPAQAFTPGAFKEAWRLPANEQRSVFVVNGNLNQRYNADGFLCYSGSSEIQSSKVWAYTQLFRSGIVEYGFSNFCHPPIGQRGLSESMIIGQCLERQMVQCYEDAAERFRRQGDIGNVYVGFSLVGIQGKSFFVSLLAWSDSDLQIRQNIFASPEVYVDLSIPEERPFEGTLRPLVDTLWQLGGRERTPFMSDGKWEPFKEYR